MLEAVSLSVSYKDRCIISGLSFQASEGKIMGICGSNGCGKSTLCKALAGLTEGMRTEGEVFYNGKSVFSMSVAERCANVGIIFQNPEYQLFSSCVEDELAFAPENLNLPREEIRERLEYALRICGAERLRSRKISELSGGEKQLVAAASVLVMKPAVIIADEITAHVDAEGREKLRAFLREFAGGGGTVLLVAHGLKDKEICDCVVDIGGGR